MKDRWLALAIGNSRLHWGQFENQQLLQVWHQPLSEFNGFLAQASQSWAEWQPFFPPWTRSLEFEGDAPELWIISVVPELSAVWGKYPRGRALTTQDVPLRSTYEGLGVDRAITLWSAGTAYGWPCLVVDGGTALTFTGADDSAIFIGGSILPGLSLQARSLVQSTATLPEIELPTQLPRRWATGTVGAIQSGILYIAIAGLIDSVQDWIKAFPNSQIILTGGDAELLSRCLQDRLSQMSQATVPRDAYIVDPHLMFLGMERLRRTLR